MTKPFKFGNLTLTLKGTNISTLINNLNKNNIKILKLKKISPLIFDLKIKAKHYEKLVAILNEKCYNIERQKHSFDWLKLSFKKTGIVFGIIVGLLLNFFATFFVWNIKLFGDETLEKEICKVLKENGICIGTLKSNLNFLKIKQTLLKNVENLSLLSLSTRGSTLIISYTSRTDSQSEDITQKNVLASQNGIIASIIVLSGTAMVKPGDYVRKGDILIAGFEEKEEKQTECEAKGQVFAYTFKSATVEFPLEKIEYARTGNFVENITLTYLGDTLFKTEKEITFEKFETTKTESYLTDTAIPLKIIFLRTYELAPFTITQNFDKHFEHLKAQARLLCFELIDGDEEILEEKTEKNFVSNIWFVTHYIKIKEKIS